MFEVFINERKHDVFEFMEPNSLIHWKTQKKLKWKHTLPTAW